MRLANLILYGALATAPAFATVIENIQSSWSVTDLATNQIVCSGTGEGGQILCPGATGDPSFSIELRASGSAGIGNGVASAELNTLVAFPQFDTDAFAVATDISITLLAEGFFVATGGTGQGFVTGSGSFQGSGSGGATFDSFSAINNVACDDLLGTCQQLIPITFGQPFQIIALANASIHRTDAGVSSAAGTGDASVLQIYDANRNLLPDAQLHLVPEPASLMLLFTGLVCLLIQKRVVQHKLAEIRQRCRW